MLALSQSGRTPDVVDYVERAAGRGAYTIAITNDVDSPLAQVADAIEHFRFLIRCHVITPSLFRR